MTARGDSVRLNLLISSAGMAALDEIAAKEGQSRSLVARCLLSDAVAAYERTGRSPALQRARKARQEEAR